MIRNLRKFSLPEGKERTGASETQKRLIFQYSTFLGLSQSLR